MSQYPSPYNPPPMPYSNYYAGQPSDPLAPARRASLLMVILGSLMLLIGLCMAGMGQMLRHAHLPPEVQTQMDQLESQTGLAMTSIFTTAGIVVLVFAVGTIVLGVLVRSGKMVWIVLSLIAVGLVVLAVGLIVLGGLFQGIVRGQPQALMGVCMWAVPLALGILQIFWLISAARRAPHAAMMQQQYAAQYWQYQQNMQQYGGYGYPPPVTPPPPIVQQGDGGTPPAV